MRIVFEGLPGAGKTTHAERLSKELRCPLIPEWGGFTEAEWTGFRFTRPFYFGNDEIKEAMARRTAEPQVVMDRHYASTLAFAYALDGVDAPDLKPNPKKDETYEGNLAWYRRCIDSDTLRRPELVLVLDIPPELSVARQPRAQQFDAVWGDPKRLEAMRQFYTQVYPDIDPTTELITISAQAELCVVYEEISRVVARRTETAKLGAL